MLRHLAYAVGAAALMGAAATSGAHADSNPYIADVMPVAFDFCPVGWAKAEGQIVSIASNQTLFALIGNRFGGNGTTNFAYPDLRGRFPVNYGTGPGLTFRPHGSYFGQEDVFLLPSNLPAHTHQIETSSGPLTNTANNSMVALRSFGTNVYRDDYPSPLSLPVTMSSGALENTGSGLPVDIRSRSLAIQWCIALQGDFPPRN